jgi:hypothetical protein
LGLPPNIIIGSAISPPGGGVVLPGQSSSAAISSGTTISKPLTFSQLLSKCYSDTTEQNKFQASIAQMNDKALNKILETLKIERRVKK